MTLQARRLVVHLSAFTLALGGVVGCSSSNSGGSGSGSGSESGSSSGTSGSGSSGSGSGASADVSFAKDIVPILQTSCSTGGTSCHGDPSVVTMGTISGGNREYLGPATGAFTAAVTSQVLDAMLNKPSLEDPSMNVVTPGNSQMSFLMYKVDSNAAGDPMLSTLTTGCATGELENCGTGMPYPGLMVLPQATRDTIRSWINQGAKNN